MRALDQIRLFARQLCRHPLYECGHADAWVAVDRATYTGEAVAALSYCAGYADAARLACVSASPAARIAETLGTAARTFVLALTTAEPIDVASCCVTYGAELRALLAEVAS